MMSRQAGDAEGDQRALHHLVVADGVGLALEDVEHLAGADDAVAVGVGGLEAVPERRGEARGREKGGHIEPTRGLGVGSRHGFDCVVCVVCVVGASTAIDAVW